MMNYNHEDDPLISDNNQPHNNASKPLARELKPAIEAIHFITEKLRLEDEQEMVEDDWQYIAMIVDRLILFVYITGCIVGTILVFYRVWLIEPLGVECPSHQTH